MKSGNGQGKNRPHLFNLSGKTAIVTGASGDIGYDIVLQLSKAGVTTAALGRDQKRLERTVKDAEAYGVKSTGYICDVRSSSQVESTVRKILNTFDHIDILVNNAGTGSLGDISTVDE